MCKKHHKEPDSAKRNTYPRTGWSAVSPVNPAQQRGDGGYADGLGCDPACPRTDAGRQRARNLLGCASPEQYVNQSAYLGASVGRYANRIAKSRFELDGVQFSLLPSRARISFTAVRTGLINAAGKLFVKTTAKCCSRWIRLMAIRASREPYRVRALYADGRQPYRY